MCTNAVRGVCREACKILSQPLSRPCRSLIYLRHLWPFRRLLLSPQTKSGQQLKYDEEPVVPAMTKILLRLLSAASAVSMAALHHEGARLRYGLVRFFCKVKGLDHIEGYPGLYLPRQGQAAAQLCTSISQSIVDARRSVYTRALRYVWASTRLRCLSRCSVWTRLPSIQLSRQGGNQISSTTCQELMT